jgi:ubiquinone/menaquinone biosynthesis C-methylase UbiE
MFFGEFMLTGESLLHGSSAADIYERYFVPAIFAQWAERAVHYAAIMPDERVLDAGCGTGIAARAASHHSARQYLVSGLDKDRDMLAVAAHKAPDIDWRHGDITDMPFSDACFDVVLCQFVLMLVSRRVAAIKEINRVMAPGGRLVMAVWAPLESSTAYVQLTGLVKATGGEKAEQTLRQPFRLGSRDNVNGIMRAGGFADFGWESCQGTARYPSIEAFIDIELAASGARAHFTEESYGHLKRMAQPAFRQWLQNNGELVIPLHAIFITASKQENSSQSLF